MAITVPMIDFSALLTAAEPAWRAHLAEMFARGQFILGPQAEAFEHRFASLTGAQHSVTVGAGTAALELSLREAAVTGPKDEVLTSALTAPFTGIGIRAAGPAIRFADVDPDTLLLNPADAAARATRRTRALVPVHLYGQPCDMDQFASLGKRINAVVVQDACQAHGARWRGKPLTTYSPYVAYSFYPTKNLGALGDGGAITTNRASTAKRLRSLRDGGRRGGQVAFECGINSRLDEMQACYLRAFAEHLETWNQRRRNLASLYDEALAGLPAVRPITTSPESVRHLYVVRAARRDKLRAHLATAGIASGVHYPVPLHLMPAFADAGLRRGSLPVAEKACREILSLPLWPLMDESNVLRTAEAIRRFYA